MSYEVLARKWRPRRFSELVGQEHVSKALINGLDNDRLHHAFLFTGTRGVGKTTIARIFAKALNCEQGVSSEPCGECPICGEVDDGRFVDLIEVDGASKTKVDDTRELLDNVQYAPTRGRYKVYLIDEVHMLSTHSFNALLKTLEEPPPHVKFLLATTDPQKLPVTVLSRCLQFNLKRLEIERIETYLKTLLDSEGVEFDDEAVRLIAAGADGSMRDGLSLLDQAIGNGGGALRIDEVRAMLGAVDRDRLDTLVDSLAAGDGKALLDSIGVLADFAPDFGALLRELASLFHRMAMVQAVADLDEDDSIRRWAGQFDPATVQLNYQIAVQARSQLHLAPDPRTGLEMAVLRMLAFLPAGSSGIADTRPAGDRGMTAPAAAIQPMPQSNSRDIPDSSRAVSRPAAPEVSTPTVAAAPTTSASTEPPTVNAPGVADEPPERPSNWGDLMHRLGLRGPPAMLAANSILSEVRTDHYQLKIDPDHVYLRSDACEEAVKAAMRKLLGQNIKVEFVTAKVEEASPAVEHNLAEKARHTAARESLEDNPLVQRLKRELGAEIVSDSVRPSSNH